MSDEEFDTQWTQQARDRYGTATAALLEALSAHTGLTGARQGRQAENAEYFESAGRLSAAINSFTDAEFDLCGSFPFPPLDLEGAEEDDDEIVDDEDGGEILTVEQRLQFRIVDEDGLMESARAAYRTLWPDDTEEDARLAVSSPSHAVGELVHALGMVVLQDGTEHLRPLNGEMSIEVGDEEDEF